MSKHIKSEKKDVSAMKHLLKEDISMKKEMKGKAKCR
jgi:hypothetical protein